MSKHFYLFTVTICQKSLKLKSSKWCVENLFTECRDSTTCAWSQSRCSLVTIKHWRIQGGNRNACHCGPILNFFMQFLGRIDLNNNLWVAPHPSGKSWIRYCRKEERISLRSLKLHAPRKLYADRI